MGPQGVMEAQIGQYLPMSADFAQGRPWVHRRGAGGATDRPMSADVGQCQPMPTEIGKGQPWVHREGDRGTRIG